MKSLGPLLGMALALVAGRAEAIVGSSQMTDVYAMGVILFEMATAQRPFQGELAEVLAKHLFEPPPAPSSLRADISPELERLILQCMEKLPADRPAGMGSLRDRLRGLSTQHMDPGAARHTLAAAKALGAGLSSASSASSVSSVSLVSPPRSRGLLGAVVAAVVLLGGGLAAWQLSRHKTAAPIAATTPAPKAEIPPKVELPPKVEVAPVPVAAVEPVKAEAVKAEAASTKLVIRTEPAGAHVTIAGKDRGRSPLVIDDALPVEVTLSLSGYKTSREVVTTHGESIFHLVADRHSRPVGAPVAAKPAAAREGLE